MCSTALSLLLLYDSYPHRKISPEFTMRQTQKKYTAVVAVFLSILLAMAPIFQTRKFLFSYLEMAKDGAGGSNQHELDFNNDNGKLKNATSLFQNSKAWLEDIRLGNANEVGLITDEFVHNLILHSAPMDTIDGSLSVLKQTMCPDKSAFMTWEEDHETLQKANSTSNAIMRLAFRLSFLALHENQFGPARNEALARRRNGTRNTNVNSASASILEQNNVGYFDYECDPDTQYLVAAHSDATGFGYAAKEFMPHINLAMSTGRVLLIMNSVPYGPKWIRNKYRAASCARQDLQCVFLPISPCVLTKTDLENATQLVKADYEHHQNTGKLPDAIDNKKVILSYNLLGGWGGPSSVSTREGYIRIISSFYEKNDSTRSIAAGWNINEELLGKVKEVIMNDTWFFDHVMRSYMLRPNLTTQRNITLTLNRILPADFNQESSIGLAIRAGDKCIEESQCMPLSDYVQLIREFAAKRTLARTGDNTTVTSLYDTVVLTSESRVMLDAARFNYTGKKDFPFQFIINDKDVMQGHGSSIDFGNTTAYKQDDVMLSSLTSIQMQMLSESTVINSCSNFHRMIQSLLLMGCSGSKNNYMETLLQNDNPAFRMRCGNGIKRRL